MGYTIANKKTICCIWVDRRNFTAYKETVNKMFQMFPNNTEVEPPSRDRCRTCAVVGNSVNLKRSHYGPLIDFQDFVISSYEERALKANMDLVQSARDLWFCVFAEGLSPSSGHVRSLQRVQVTLTLVLNSICSVSVN
ncbi:CMP-N-acetylneuraminate-beta-galactosamide-alpha-2,3-sialyltransferase 1 [Liparis tanakae]|uniref:CMP-N-acetylneuraminate-beta-galactosamide-alpha-2,3-sialyltransferase 1 n=1 Tax=Liparis tanakae TaxID=230148 RepID=A0A4Z2EYB5_9TELE|nr:CMP-N-acetylneuraminate-beta-galactosamide-alpha-2,3-sialyltransferase 1 [Liparis tanakae]